MIVCDVEDGVVWNDPLWIIWCLSFVLICMHNLHNIHYENDGYFMYPFRSLLAVLFCGICRFVVLELIWWMAIVSFLRSQFVCSKQP